jgi:hypothetical protein
MGVLAGCILVVTLVLELARDDAAARGLATASCPRRPGLRDALAATATSQGAFPAVTRGSDPLERATAVVKAQEASPARDAAWTLYLKHASLALRVRRCTRHLDDTKWLGRAHSSGHAVNTSTSWASRPPSTRSRCIATRRRPEQALAARRRQHNIRYRHFDALPRRARRSGRSRHRTAVR